MLNTSVTQIASIIATTESLGQKVPADVSKAHERYQRIMAGAATIYRDGHELNAATLTALDEGRDPAADPEVQRIATSQLIGNEHQVQALRTVVTDDLLQAVARNANAIVKAWQKPFDVAVQTIARTAKQLGPIRLDDSAVILAQGGAAAQHWTEAKQADTLIHNIAASWTILAMQTQFAPNDRRLQMLRITDPTYEQWESLELIDQRMSAWDAHHAGLALSLADGPEFNARWQRIESEREQRSNQRRDQVLGKNSPESIAQMLSTMR